MKAPVRDNGHKEAASRLAGLLDMVEGTPLREHLKELLTDPQFLLFLSMGQLPEAIFIPEELAAKAVPERAIVRKGIKVPGIEDIRFAEVANPVGALNNLRREGTVKELLKPLADALPWLEDVKLATKPLPKDMFGQYNPALREVQLAAARKPLGTVQRYADAMHELQHAALDRPDVPRSLMGWTPAASVERAKQVSQGKGSVEALLAAAPGRDAAKLREIFYKNNLGEILARESASRALLDPAGQMWIEPTFEGALMPWW